MTLAQDTANIKAIAQSVQPISGLTLTATIKALTDYKDGVGTDPVVNEVPATWDDLTTSTGEARTSFTVVPYTVLPDITA